MPLVTAASLLWLGAAPAARAQDLEAHRPLLPAWSPAGDDGAGALWSNVANLGLDPDPSWFGAVARPLGGAGGTALHLAGNLGPLASGLSYLGGGAAGVPAWWSLSSGLGLQIDRGLAIGGRLAWHLPEGPENNFLTGDLGATWRPIPWLGISGTAWDVGAREGGPGGLRPRVGPGLALRPFEDRLLIGADWSLPPGLPDQGRLRGTVRVRPVDAMVVRLSAEQGGVLGFGLELLQGGAGAGAFAAVPTAADGQPVGALYARSAPDKRGDLFARPRVAALDLNGAYPYRNATGILARPEETWLELLQRLRTCADDPTLDGVVIRVEDVGVSFAQLEEARAELLRMRAAGKTVVAYIDGTGSNGGYWLASAADEVWLHPVGELDLIGLSAELQFLRGSLDLLGVEPQFVRRSEYKSAPETFQNTRSSEPAREQMNALLDDLSRRMMEDIGAARGKDPGQVQAWVDGGPYAAEEARAAGLVDGLAYPDELEDLLDRTFGDGAQVDDSYGLDVGTEGWRARREIAVVVIDGAIIPGESTGPGFFGGGFATGSDTVVAQLDEARDRMAVEAVVLRVDSPGGSAFASDEIWRAVRRLEDAGKPVVVSMGGVAASGGYYVSAGARAIYAMPTTITGSIGVYAGPMLNLEGLYEKIGLSTELYTRGRKAGMYSMGKPLDDIERDALDRLVGTTYAQFKGRVAEGRGMEAAQVEQVARGRVWSGARALEADLVDGHGGFFDAVDRARIEAGIPLSARADLVRFVRVPGLDDGMTTRPIGAELSPAPGARLAAGLQARVPAPPPLPELPGVDALRTWGQLADERVWALAPYAIEVE